jgi:hypothetical protein
VFEPAPTVRGRNLLASKAVTVWIRLVAAPGDPEDVTNTIGEA